MLNEFSLIMLEETEKEETEEETKKVIKALAWSTDSY